MEGKKGNGKKTAAVLIVITAGCLIFPLLPVKNPQYMDLAHCNRPPCPEFLFGTDSMGRDLFSMIWSGGRISLLIGIGAAAISFGIAAVVGTAAACAGARAGELLISLTDLLICIPELLLVMFLQAIAGKATVFSLIAVIGLSGWMSMAKVIRTETVKIRSAGYIEAAQCMGAGFWYQLRCHLLPNFLPAVLYMAVMNIRSAILMESALSFMGLGLPVGVISWGSLLSLAQNAMLTGAWWVVVIPGVFLTTVLVCITDLAGALQRKGSRKEQNL